MVSKRLAYTKFESHSGPKYPNFGSRLKICRIHSKHLSSSVEGADVADVADVVEGVEGVDASVVVRSGVFNESVLLNEYVHMSYR